VWNKITAVPWEPRSARPLDEHIKLPAPAPLVASTLREDQLAQLAENLEAAPAAPAASTVAVVPPAPPPPQAPAASKRPAAESAEQPAEKRAAPSEMSSEIIPMMDESTDNEAKRTRFAAAVSLDEPIDYEPLEGLTIDLLSKISHLTDDEELEGKKGALEMLAHYGVYKDVPISECGT
jgi:hypothetical protein